MPNDEKVSVELSDGSQIRITGTDFGLVSMALYVPILQDGKPLMAIKGTTLLTAPVVRVLRGLLGKGRP